jgi:hypothetical protein
VRAVQFSIKNMFLFVTGASVGIVLSKTAAVVVKNQNTHLTVITLGAAMAFWGLGLGGLLNCPWRGLVIGFLSATITLAGYLAFGGI